MVLVRTHSFWGIKDQTRVKTFENKVSNAKNIFQKNSEMQTIYVEMQSFKRAKFFNNKKILLYFNIQTNPPFMCRF